MLETDGGQNAWNSTHSKQKVKNCPSYNRALKNRGRLDFMIAENLGESWYEERVDYKRRERQKEYSDLSIEQFIKIRCLFGLKLRQT